MLRRIISTVYEEMTRPPGGSIPPLPPLRMTDEPASLRAEGERVRRRPEPEAMLHEERRERPTPRRPPTPAAAPEAGLDIAGALRSPAEVRRAFVLMELLGPPVSLRERPEY